MRYIGRPIQYSITVTNQGSTEARNVVLTDTPGAGISLTGASDSGQMSGGRISWNLGNMAPGATRTVTVNATSSAAGQFKNSACATAVGAQACGEATVEVKGINAILLEVVDDPDPVEKGANTTYTISAYNQGSAVGTNMVIECVLPDQEEFVASGGATTGTASGRTVTFAPLPSLAPKARATWYVTVKALAEGDVRFTTRMKTAEMRGEPVMETESTNIYK